MKKLLFTIVLGLLGIVGAYAQGSFDTALLIHEGTNSTAALDLDGDRGAYFKYVASEQVVISLTARDNENFYLYLDDTTQTTYDYTSTTDANYVTTYSMKLAAGQTLYVLAKQGYSATGTEVGFDAKLFTNVLQHGMSKDDPIALESGATYWFEGGNAYFNYTAADNGVLVLTQHSYCYGASYTVDGVTKDLIWDSNSKEMSLAVEAGHEYSIWTSSSSYSMFFVSALFTQPKQGETIGNPYALVIGDNTVPAEAGKYYYKFLNDGDLGFLTVKAEGCVISARTVGNTYDNLSSNNEGTMRLQLDMDQECIITLDKKEATAEAQVMTAQFALPEAGDIETNPIVLTPSEDTQVSAPSGVKFYSLTNNSGQTAFLRVIVDTEGISSYGTTQVKVYKKSEGYQYGGSSLSSGEEFKVVLEPDAEYMIRVSNVEDAPVLFRTWFSAINPGDVYSMPITAKLGKNTVEAEGQKFYEYTAASNCRLTLTVGNSETTTAFFPMYDGDEYYGRDLLSSGDGVYVLAAEAGQKYIFRITGASIGEQFTISEEAYGAGQTKENAIEMTGTYTFDDLNPYKLWLVYNVKEDGIAEITPNGFSGISYYDNIYYSVNDGSESNISGYDADYQSVMLTKTVAVKAGDKLYFHIDVQSYQEGATIAVAVREALPGEAASNPLSIAVNEPVSIPLVGYGGSRWYAFDVETECDVTFSATEYASVSLYDKDVQQIKCGEYSDAMTLGAYYEPYVLKLAPGRYYMNVTYTDGTDLTVSGTGIVSGIAALQLPVQSSGVIYNLAGQRVSNGKGIVVVNGKKALNR